jgi:PadR family transcriptional regulator PadR
MSGRATNRLDLLQGTLDMIVLQTLTWGPQHGYGITQIIRSGTSDVLQVETGSLYPALHRLERQGWVTAEWRQSEYNQRTRVYRLTPAGRKRLADQHNRWTRLHAAIDGLMRAKDAPA